ncbi:MAG: gliding motility-associated C-terminal domain-containing protein [Elusimicrobia bacterium]|nr:gliding motility-associated C-terminal domain-containing protein [Elusimicrobiota bacterium]
MTQRMKTTEKAVILAAGLLILALLAVAAFAQSDAFSFLGPVSRVITPNGDGRNDYAFVRFCNPAGSGVTGKIYSLFGSEVASMSDIQTGLNACQDNNTTGWSQYLTWDGRSNGSVVPSGIYIYRITAEQRVYTGTLIVVR